MFKRVDFMGINLQFLEAKLKLKKGLSILNIGDVFSGI
jgi:hypothetical protein